MFSRHISRSNAVVQENLPFHFQARVVLKPLVSLIGRFVARGARISVYTHTHTHTRARGPPFAEISYALPEKSEEILKSRVKSGNP